jgi:hypothetical protein
VGRRPKHGDASCRHCRKTFRKKAARQMYCSRSCFNSDYWTSYQTSTPYTRYYIQLINKEK